jgi:hypothetical protein
MAANYTNGFLAGRSVSDFTKYERFVPRELLAPPADEREETAYQRVVRLRIERSLPPKPSEESAADRWARERDQRRWAEARAKAAALRRGPRLTPPRAGHTATNAAQWNAWFVERFLAFMDDEQGEFVATLGSLVAEERRDMRDYVANAAAEFEAKLAAKEERKKQREDARRAAVNQRIEQSVDLTRKLITEAIGTERDDRRSEVAKEVGELRSAVKAMGETIAAERGARRDEVAEAIAGLRSQLDTMNKVIAAERQAGRDEIARLGEEISQARRPDQGKARGARGAYGAISGKLPIAKAWSPETVTYQGAFVVHDGACWQAVKDTAQRPGGCDWVNVARAGRDGRDGASLNLRGPYDTDKSYYRLDVVEFGGDAFVARRNGAGLCPGEDWLPFSAHGPKGDKGETGPRATAAIAGLRGSQSRSATG